MSWNWTEPNVGLEVKGLDEFVNSTSSPPSLLYSVHKNESLYSIFYNTYNPSSLVYSVNSTVLGVPLGVLKFCIEGIAVTTLSILGIIGNVLSIAVLTSPRMRSPTICFMVCLAVCDTIALISIIPLLGIPSLLIRDPEHGSFAYNLKIAEYGNNLPGAEIFAITCTAYAGSVFFTMSLTVERYIAVCYPIYGKFLRTWKRPIVCAGMVFILVILFILPRWFEFTYVTENIRNFTIRRPVPTQLRMDPIYDAYYYHLAYILLLFIIPICVLVVFNVLTYRKIREAYDLRRSMSPLMTAEMKNEHSLARMLFGVVIVFLACQITPAVRQFYRYTYGINELVAEVEFVWIFLLVVNSSVNFLIYFFAGTRFRETFYQLFCRCRDSKSILNQRDSSKSQTVSLSISSLSKSQQKLETTGGHSGRLPMSNSRTVDRSWSAPARDTTSKI